MARPLYTMPAALKASSRRTSSEMMTAIAILPLALDESRKPAAIQAGNEAKERVRPGGVAVLTHADIVVSQAGRVVEVGASGVPCGCCGVQVRAPARHVGR